MAGSGLTVSLSNVSLLCLAVVCLAVVCLAVVWVDVVALRWSRLAAPLSGPPP
jgi:hypothetical protein